MRRLLVIALSVISALAIGKFVVYTYDSMVDGLGKEVKSMFERMYGVKVELRSFGDAGKMLSRLVMEGEKTEADVVLGLDQTLLIKAKPYLFPYKPINYEKIRKSVDFERIKRVGLTVVADLLYSAAVGYLDTFVKELAAEYEVIHDYRDPYFGGGRPEPDEGRMRMIGETVKDRKWMVGIAVDGDADRFGIVDDEGDFVKPNEVIALLADHLYRNRGLKGPVARSIATSHALDRVARAFGEDVMETPVGFKFLGPLLMQQGVVIAGEESGGLSIVDHVPEKDGILADLLVLEMIAYEGKRLSEIRKEFRERYGELYNTRIDLEVEDASQRDELVERFRHIGDEFAGLKVTGRDEMDGVRYTFDAPDTWLLARPSGTEPLVRVYIESGDQRIFRNLISEVKKMVR